MAKIVVLGVGNVLLGDEGVGVHAIEKLKEKINYPEVELIDGATAGLDLLPVLESCDYLLIIDCVKGGLEPGSIYKFAPEDMKVKLDNMKLSIHDFNLVDVLNLAKALGKKLPEITIYGVEPESMDWSLEMSKKVSQALEKLIKVVINDLENLISKLEKGS